MRKNDITDFFNLQEVKVDFHKCSKNLIELWIKCPVKEHICPSCKSSTSRVHDYYLRSFNHIKVGKRTTRIYYKRRRYVCTNCGKKFAEKVLCAVLEKNPNQVILTERFFQKLKIKDFSCF